MTNEATNETEESQGDTPVAGQKTEQESSQPAAAAPATESTTQNEEAPPPPAGSGGPAPGAPSLAANAPRIVRKPVQAATADEPAAGGDIDFGAILEQFEQEQTTYHAGELVEGKVVGVSDRGILVDFGYKSEGIIPAEEASAAQEEISVGDEIEVVIKAIHAGDAPPVLSRADAVSRRIWIELEDAFKEGRPVTGRIVDKTKGGLRVDLNGIEAFLPGSQIDSRPIRSLDTYKDQEIEAKIIKFSRRRNNIVLSRKVITDELMSEEKNRTLGQIDVGYVIEGTIKNLTEYGAFVDIGGIDGLLHITDMSWGRLQNPAEMFKVNDNVQVKVLKLDREKEKISLGYKQLLPDPWSTVVEVYPVDSRVTGKVSSVTDYGIFVELEPGVEGLVHVSEISWSKRAANPKRMFNRGDEVEVQVLGVDAVEKRISLGMKQLQDNPWYNIAQRYPVGTKVHGRVRNLTDFGAFVEIEDGIDGLVHISDITWAKKLKHPKELLKKDQEVDAIVTHIDSAGQRLSLSMKDLTPSAWETFVATHRPGDVVRGKVSRFTSFGIFVELGEGLEGLCHISELSDERVESAESVAHLGQEMDFKILRIEQDTQKIGLSHRAIGKDEEPVVDTRVYSTEAKGGMASLGELANLTKAAEDPQREMTKEEKEEAKRERKARARQEYEEAAARAQAEAEAGNADAEALEGEAGTAEAELPEAEARTADADAPRAQVSDEPAPPEGSSTSADIEPQETESAAEAAANDPEAAVEQNVEGTSEANTEARAEAAANDPDLAAEQNVEGSAEAGTEAGSEAAANDPESVSGGSTPGLAEENEAAEGSEQTSA
jgi:small subunit ribosomal protein S1